jgi:hypothetical protein
MINEDLNNMNVLVANQLTNFLLWNISNAESNIAMLFSNNINLWTKSILAHFWVTASSHISIIAGLLDGRLHV